MTMVPQEYEVVSLDVLQNHPENPRRGDLDALSNSVNENGFYGALVVQRSTQRVLAGNHRLMAARKAGMKAVPVTYVDVDDMLARRILLADNRINDLASYDEDALVAILGDMPDLTGTGWTMDDLAKLANVPSFAEDDEQPRLDESEGKETHQTTCPSCGHEFIP